MVATTYILLGVSGALIAFALVILIAMVPCCSKTNKIDSRINGLTKATTRHWDSIRMLSELNNQLDEKVRKQSKEITKLNNKISWLENIQ